MGMPFEKKLFTMENFQFSMLLVVILMPRGCVCNYLLYLSVLNAMRKFCLTNNVQ